MATRADDPCPWIELLRAVRWSRCVSRSALVDDSLHGVPIALRADALATLEAHELPFRVLAVDRADEVELAVDQLAISVLSRANSERCGGSREIKNEGRDRRDGGDEQEALEEYLDHCALE